MEESDSQLIYFALNMWANYIETGDISIGAEDVKRMGKHATTEVKALSLDQMKKIIRLRELANKHL